MGTQTQTASDARAIADFNAAVAEQQGKPGFSDRKKASCEVARRQPELHRSFIIATNTNPAQRRVLGA